MTFIILTIFALIVGTIILGVFIAVRAGLQLRRKFFSLAEDK